jgi:hypothetical protein
MAWASAELATLAQDRVGWLELVTKAPFAFGIGKAESAAAVISVEKRGILARRAQ